MAQLKNPFGVRNGKIILIEDLTENERGNKCDCICPSCGDPFEARMGNVRVHHFAHSGEGCDEVNAYMTGLYMLVSEYLSAGYPLYLPTLALKFICNSYSPITPSNAHERIRIISYYQKTEDDQLLVSEEGYWRCDSSDLVYDSKNRVEAILVKIQGKSLAIRLTPPESICSVSRVGQYQNYPTLEINFTDHAETIGSGGKDMFFLLLRKNHSIFRWISNPKAKQRYPEIYEKSQKYYENAKKIREEKERLQQEQRERQYEEWQYKMQKKREQRTNAEIQSPKSKHQSSYEDVKDLFTQQDTVIKDRYGNRWVQCEICGEIKLSSEFSVQGGANKVNLGRCRDCMNRK